MRKLILYLEKNLIKFLWIILFIFLNLGYQNNLVKSIQNTRVIMFHKYLKLKLILLIYQILNKKILILLNKYQISFIKMKKLSIRNESIIKLHPHKQNINYHIFQRPQSTIVLVIVQMEIIVEVL